MKYLELLALSVALFVTVDMSAQYHYEAASSEQYFKLSNGKVLVDFSIDPGTRPVTTQHRRSFIPVLMSHDSLHTVELDPVVLVGRIRNLKDIREEKEQTVEYVRYLAKEVPSEGIHYTASVPYEPWMDSAALYIRENVCGCADCGVSDETEVCVPELLYSPEILLSDETECPVEYTPRSNRCDAFLIYPRDSYVLRSDLYGNRKELDKIDSVLLFVKNNPAYEIQRMEITGFASPEATYEYNIRLAEQRAGALEAYIEKNHQIPDSLMTVNPGAENWEDLEAAVRASDVPYREKILNIMETEEDPDIREWKIKILDEGRPYRIIYETMYPSLRKNTFMVSYISRERPLDEAHELVFSDPGELNVYEFYRVAGAFYSDDPEAYGKVLMIAADTYPGHSIANNNAARAAMAAGDMQKAYKYLLNTRNEDFTLGNRAYYAYQEGRMADAAALWQMAAEKGDAKAAANLEELNRRGY